MMPADVNLNIDIDKKGEGDKEAAAGLELVAHAADNAKDELAQLDRKLLETRAALVAAGKTFAQTGDISPFKQVLKDQRELTTVRRSLAAIGDDAKKSAQDATNLNKAIADTKRLLSDLGAEYKRSGTIELNHYRSLTSELRKLEQVKRDLDRLTGNGQGLLGGSLGKGLDAISGTAPTGIVQWLVSGAVLAGPAIGAAINSAVLLGVGGGTLAAGIALAAQSPVVRGAYADLGKYVHEMLTDAAGGLEEPVARSAGIMRDAFNQVLPGIHADFQAVAPAVDHLAAGIGKLAINVMPGFNEAVAASVPLLNQLGDDTLPRMGSAMGQFFSSIAQGGPGAQAFFRDLTTIVDLSVKQLGSVTLALSKVYEESSKGSAAGAALTGTFNFWATALDKLDGGSEKVHKSFQLLNQDATTLPASVNQVGLGASLTADAFSKLSSKINATAMTSDVLAGQMATKLLNTTLSLDQATLGFAQAQTALSESIKNNGRELDIHTAKGEANRAAILSTVSANIQAYQANIQAGISAEDAARAYDQNTAALEQQLRKAGLTTQQIDGLIGKYRNVPANVDTEIATKGLTEAINGLSDLIRQINGIPNYKRVNVEVAYSTTGAGGTSAGLAGGIRPLARGGIISGAASGVIANRPFIIGEKTLPEAAIPAPNSGISQARADALLGTAASWWGRRLVPAGGGGGGTVINVTVNAGMGANGYEVGDQVLEALRTAIKSRGGNVQMILAGKPAM